MECHQPTEDSLQIINPSQLTATQIKDSGEGGGSSHVKRSGGTAGEREGGSTASPSLAPTFGSASLASTSSSNDSQKSLSDGTVIGMTLGVLGFIFVTGLITYYMTTVFKRDGSLRTNIPNENE